MTWRTATGVVATAVAGALVLSACTGSDADSSTSPSASAQDVSISVATVGDIGLEALATQYMADHPNVTITVTQSGYADLHDTLQNALVAGSGAPTIAVLDEAYMPSFVGQSDGFVNLLDLGASQYQSTVLPWAWAEASNANGSATIGLPASVSGLALCYRRDLLEAAGLPGDRTELSAQMGDSWDGFLSTAEQYTTSSGHYFLDNAETLLNPLMMQAGVSFYDRDNALAMDPVQAPFTTAVEAATAGISANVTQWTDDWTAGLYDDTYAAVLCPSWMLAYIQTNAPEGFTGQWDVADIPGAGGNWAASYYTIPAQSDEATTAAAYAFIQWLMEDAQQLARFQAVGAFPATPALYTDASIQAYSDSFFNNAPIGTIFTKTAQDLTGEIYYAQKNTTIRTSVEHVVDQVEAGEFTADDAWAAAVDAAQTADAS
ncbi:ABC transporter substrate-binding protein [Demequina capsici]|uniref:ABC transporter substrate-binding protein n=1 Tax=Demequina capsici TaxID=3075620 RepID=A0AA96JAX7_9MICO|nr:MULTISPECIES: ABC transporter substrate-binding protein [unclassified Demequina]WNM25186.1 ABC transporter substrate-binding protein [Demequina sp. OYTSA14]WNM28099.1 ABC transporter substrate-binding protein [Demequina sp. PMTSA13]